MAITNIEGGAKTVRRVIKQKKNSGKKKENEKHRRNWTNKSTQRTEMSVYGYQADKPGK